MSPPAFGSVASRFNQALRDAKFNARAIVVRFKNAPLNEAEQRIYARAVRILAAIESENSN